MACDIVLASDSASFSLPEAALGLVPGYGVLRAPSIIGRQWMNLLIMAGETIDTQTALSIGLVQRQVADDDLMETALTIARAIASRSAHAVATAKKLAGGTTEARRIEESIAAISTLHQTDEARESRAAFMRRHKPS
jgi:enoyl-CoA hydratase